MVTNMAENQTPPTTENQTHTTRYSMNFGANHALLSSQTDNEHQLYNQDTFNAVENTAYRISEGFRRDGTNPDDKLCWALALNYTANEKTSGEMDLRISGIDELVRQARGDIATHKAELDGLRNDYNGRFEQLEGRTNRVEQNLAGLVNRIAQEILEARIREGHLAQRYIRLETELEAARHGADGAVYDSLGERFNTVEGEQTLQGNRIASNRRLGQLGLAGAIGACVLAAGAYFCDFGTRGRVYELTDRSNQHAGAKSEASKAPDITDRRYHVRGVKITHNDVPVTENGAAKNGTCSLTLELGDYQTEQPAAERVLIPSGGRGFEDMKKLAMTYRNRKIKITDNNIPVINSGAVYYHVVDSDGINIEDPVSPNTSE
jgi:hypothetical protein